MHLLEYEQNYCKVLKKQYSRLIKLYLNVSSNSSFSLRKSDITKAILFRMKTYYEVSDKITKFLNKRSVSPGPDFFVETVVFYLKLFFEKRKKSIEVHSERKLKSEMGAMKPDISIWKDGKVIAIIECKTNLGWNRKNWKKDFLKREKDLKKYFPKAKAFLLVLSSINWSGFSEKDNRVGKQFFALSSEALRKIGDQPLENVIKNKIEGLFKEISSLK